MLSLPKYLYRVSNQLLLREKCFGKLNMTF
jgi:hypothetical protein